MKRLAIRYREPYAARHSSVSWNLMRGRNPLFVAQQHGHSVLTMLNVYAAWTDGALPGGRHGDSSGDAHGDGAGIRGSGQLLQNARALAIQSPIGGVG